MMATKPQLPQAGQPYRVSLFGGPLDGKSGTVISEGGLNEWVEFEVKEVRVRYLRTGGGSHAGGKSAWSYQYSPES